jgi:NAD(P)-dependent dehydrogenase (short-subunit alcohol dehydrogenase family)
MDLGLKDQVVFITGASRGIGRATAELLVGEGCSVAITGRDEDSLRRAVDELGGEERVLGVRGDMTDNADIERAVGETIERFGHIDVLVTCAGSSPGGLLENLTEEEWFGSLNLKFMGYVRSCRAVIPHMLERGGGYLLQTVSAAGLLTHPQSATYAVTKHASLAFAEWISMTYGDRGIRVSALCPQGVRTDMLVRGRDRGSASADLLTAGALEAEQVAEVVAKALDGDSFLILPHPEVAEYYRRRAADPDRWLGGMNKMQRAFES